MPVIINIPTALRPYAGGNPELAFEAKTVGDALDQLTAAHAELRKHLYNDQNKLRSFVNIYINDEDVRYLDGPETAVKEGDSISIIPSIAGGATIEPELPTSDLPSLSNDEIAPYIPHLILPEAGVEVQPRPTAPGML